MIYEEKYGGWNIRCRLGKSLMYISWASRELLVSDDPLSEPAKSVWFEFGETRDVAVSKLKRELDTREKRG